LGHIFGFTYKENFNYPYIARSITDFWRRWHISLSSFFRDYVYIPLGGNRHLQVRNMLIVWLLTGLWHGASWNFVLWGLYYGVFLIVEKWADRKDLTLPGPIAWSVSMMIVLFGWGIFYFTDFTRLIQFTKGSRLIQFTKGFFCVNGLYASQYMKMVTVWYQSFWLLVAGILAATPLPRNLYHKYIACRKPLAILWNSAVTGCALYLCFIFLVGESYNPFLYFRF
ncbi:MAG: MBOAT family protein, partial [Clostridiales bacterium]|nr:MBOAT family protein [Clostridiales bacterium]